MNEVWWDVMDMFWFFGGRGSWQWAKGRESVKSEENVRRCLGAPRILWMLEMCPSVPQKPVWVYPMKMGAILRLFLVCSYSKLSRECFVDALASALS
jgi:hypothetical protein